MRARYTQDSTVGLPTLPSHGYLVEMATRSVDVVSRCCISLGLECWDALASTSRLLSSLGYGQYRVREFWAKLSSKGGLVWIPLYSYGGAELGLSARLYEGPFYEYNCDRYIIPLMRGEEPNLHRTSLRHVPRGLALQASIEGKAGGAYVKINAVRLLVLLYKSRPTLAESLVSAVIEAGWGRPHRLVGVVNEVSRELSSILGVFLPQLPKDQRSVSRYLPFLSALGL
jgi:hypothetical protein